MDLCHSHVGNYGISWETIEISWDLYGIYFLGWPSTFHGVTTLLETWKTLCEPEDTPFTVDLPIENGDFPIENGDFPIKNDDFPMTNGDLPIENGDRP